MPACCGREILHRAEDWIGRPQTPFQTDYEISLFQANADLLSILFLLTISTHVLPRLCCVCDRSLFFSGRPPPFASTLPRYYWNVFFTHHLRMLHNILKRGALCLALIFLDGKPV